jgi:hypothetical protein
LFHAERVETPLIERAQGMPSIISICAGAALVNST